MRRFLGALLCVALAFTATACLPEQSPTPPAAVTPLSVAAVGVSPAAAPAATPVPSPTLTPTPTPTPSPTPTPTAMAIATPSRQTLSVGLVAANDNEPRLRMVRDSLQQTGRDLGVEVAVVPADPGDLARSATRLAEAGYDVVILASHNPPLGAWLAPRYPQTRFVVFGPLPDPAPANLTGLDFAEDQAGFLAGVLAGWLTQRDMVAFVGASPSVDVVKYRKGYEHGVQYVNRKAIVLGAYLEGTGDARRGADEARVQLNEGADVLFAAVGTTARGALEAGAARGVPVIAAEADLYDTARLLAPQLAMSAVVRLDRGIADVVRAAKLGTLKGGTTLVYDLNNGGVELSPFHDWETRVPEGAKREIRDILDGLRKGTVKTNVIIPQY